VSAQATVSALPLDELAEGQVHRLWLHLVDDALGRPVVLPALVARGIEPGPVLGVCAAVHGDEVNGVAVIHRMFAKLDASRLCGSVVALPVVNVPAFHRHARRTQEGFDLNHHFPGRADGREIEQYAFRLMERFVARLDLLVDLHTASRGRANSLYIRADMTVPEAARMAYLQRPQIILHNPPRDLTLRGAAQAIGVPAITVEVGNPSRFQPEYIRRSVVGLRSILADREMIRRRAVDPGPQPVVCSGSDWIYTEEGGFLEVFPRVTEHVAKGQPIARIRDAFGQLVRTYDAPHDGIVIGRSVDPVAASGARILHLGRVADPDAVYVRRHDA